MSQVPAHFETSVSDADPANKPPFSVAAITSLVFSLLFCIPGLAILGLLCGIFGIFATSGGARRGRGLAISGVLISLLVAALYVGVTITTVPWIMTRAVGTETFMKSGPQDALKAAFAGNVQVVQDHFMDQSMPSKEEVLAFTTAATSRWGKFQDEVKVGTPMQDGPDGNNFKISIKLTFESGVVPGVAFLTVGDTESSQLTDLAVFQPKNTFDSFMLIDKIRIEPTAGEPLQLGSGMVTASRSIDRSQDKSEKKDDDKDEDDDKDTDS